MFNIGDKVILIGTDIVGTVQDRLLSERDQRFRYAIQPNDGGGAVIRGDDGIELYKEPTEYVAETQIADNVAIAIIYEIKDQRKTEVCRGHGHIIHEGAEGIAQACSYAYKKAFEHIDNGIYFK